MTTIATRSGVSATQAVAQLAIRLTSGDKDPIRGMKAPDGRTVFSVFDAMWNTGAYAGKSGVNMAFGRLIANGSEYRDEVLNSCEYLKFAGSGQRNTPCMDIRGLQRLIALLGGKIGAEYRRLAETTLTRLVAGDESMISEIEENAASDAPIQTLAREALAHEPLLADAPPAPAIEDTATSFEVLARMPPALRQAFVTNLEVAVVVKERLVEAENKLADAFGRRVSFEQQRAEIARVHVETERVSQTVADARAASEQKRKREDVDLAAELGEVVKRFAAAPPAERELLRYAFAAQIAPLIPAKRTRDRFVAKLVSAPAGPDPKAEPKGGVYVLKLEDGTYYVGESKDIPVRVAQHKAGQGASFTAALGATAVSVPPITSGSPGSVHSASPAPTLTYLTPPLWQRPRWVGAGGDARAHAPARHREGPRVALHHARDEPRPARGGLPPDLRAQQPLRHLRAPRPLRRPVLRARQGGVVLSVGLWLWPRSCLSPPPFVYKMLFSRAVRMVFLSAQMRESLAAGAVWGAYQGLSVAAADNAFVSQLFNNKKPTNEVTRWHMAEGAIVGANSFANVTMGLYAYHLLAGHMNPSLTPAQMRALMK
jgi:hypothetical protein